MRNRTLAAEHLLVCAISFATLSPALHAEVAQRTHFLSDGPGAEAQAMGQAFTAIADDVTAIYYNPAGLVVQPGAVHAEHTPVYDGGRYNFLGAHYPSSIGSFGFGVIQYADSGIEGRQTLSDTPTDLSASQTAFFLPYAFGWRDWSVGSSLKVIHYNLAGFTATGWGVDAGLMHASDFNDFLIFREPTLNLGLSIKNLIQPAITLVEDEEKIPTDYKGGVAFSSDIFGRYNRDRNVNVYDHMTVSIDMAKTPGQTLIPSCGAEYSFHGMFPIRLGYDQAVTGGIGYGGPKHPFKIDYSFSLTGLGPQHRISLEYRFTDPKVKRIKAPQAQFQLGIFNEVKRYRNRHMERGKALLDNRQYDQAIAEFEYARLLDPQNHEVQRYVQRAVEGDKLARVKRHLDLASEEQASKQFDGATNSLLAAASILPKNEEVRAAFPALRNVMIKYEQDSEFPEPTDEELVKGFDARREAEVQHIRTDFDAAVKANDVLKARHLVDQAVTVDPDSSVTAALTTDLRDAEEGIYTRSLEICKKFRLSGNLPLGYAFLTNAKLVHKDSDAVREEEHVFKKVYAQRRHERRASSLFEEQLYDAAALSYVKGNTDDSVKQLNELLNLNPTSNPGSQLREELLVKQLVKEEE